MRILIIGGVAGGASAATKARRTNEDAEIIVFEKGPYVSFANCGLPYYVGGDVEERDDLLLVTPKLFKNRFNIDVRPEHEVLEILPEKKCITVKNAEGVTEEPYDKLIIATGCAPVLPKLEGINLPGVHTVAKIGDVDAITEALAAGAQNAVVVGAGFIGVETTEALLKRGLKVTLVEMLPQVLAMMDPEFSAPVERHLKRLGAKMMLNKGVESIVGTDKVEGVVLNNGTTVPADLVIMSVGMRPRLELAEKAGIKIGENHGVVCNERMETSIPDIYAAGDIVEAMNKFTGKYGRNPLASSANKQGRVAGCNAAGGNLTYPGALGTSIVRAGELAVAKTGLNEKECIAMGLDYFVSYNSSKSHASWFPGVKPIILKLIAEKGTGRLLGGQTIGRDGADKRIDVISTAIYGGLTVYDLENLDLAYAPPFSSARDPILMAGMVASNILRGILKPVTAAEIKELAKNEEYQVVDTRREDEFLCGGIRGAVNIPVDEMRNRFEELDKSKKIVLYCGEGYRSYVAGCFLAQKGFDVYNLAGGYNTYVMDV